MASEDIGALYPTKMPGYEDPADIKAALRLYHYGSETYNPATTNPNDIPPNSIAGYLKSIEADIDVLDARGIGSDFGTNEPTLPADGFIWVDAESVVPIINNPVWQLKQSGNLSGNSLSLSGISGEKFYVILKDWSHSNSEEQIGLIVRFNSDSGPNYVNTGGLISASALVSPEFANTATHDLTIKVDLANTAAMLKPVETIADTSMGSYFGYYKNTNSIFSVQISLSGVADFDAGSYQLWSYE